MLLLLLRRITRKIPLIILTADRPEEWVGQADGQTINQKGIYHNYIKYETSLPVACLHSDDQWYAKRIVSEAFIKATCDAPGPVHINIPLREPLYDQSNDEDQHSNSISQLEPIRMLSENQLTNLAHQWNQYNSVMIICGVNQPNEELNKVINIISRQSNTVVLTETTSNIKGERIIESIDRQVFSLDKSDESQFAPELLISFGGQIVSKQIKKFLRANAPKEHWQCFVKQ